MLEAQLHEAGLLALEGTQEGLIGQALLDVRGDLTLGGLHLIRIAAHTAVVEAAEEQHERHPKAKDQGKAWAEVVEEQQGTQELDTRSDGCREGGDEEAYQGVCVAQHTDDDVTAMELGELLPARIEQMAEDLTLQGDAHTSPRVARQAYRGDLAEDLQGKA